MANASKRKEGYWRISTRETANGQKVGRRCTRYAPKRKVWIEQSIYALMDDGYFSKWRTSAEVARWLTENMPGNGRWSNVTSSGAGQLLRRFIGKEEDTLRLRIIPSALQRQYISQEAWEALDGEQRIKIESQTAHADEQCEQQRIKKRRERDRKALESR